MKLSLNMLVGLFLLCQPSCSSTTIACDGQTMAADSQITVNGVRKHSISSKISIINGAVIGCAGLLTDCMKFKLWWNLNAPVSGTGLPAEKADRPKFKSLSALVALQDGSLWLYEEKCLPQRVMAPYAVGSGSPYALMQMLNGKTATDAVAVACQEDLFSGLPVVTVPVMSIPCR
jgi:hypothetical protein